MIFDITRTLDVVRRRGTALEFGENRGIGFAEDARQHVEPPAMGHADDEFLGTESRRALDDRFEGGYDALRAFEREALRTGVFHVEEALEALGLVELAQDRHFLAAGERLPVPLALHHPLDPGFPVRVLDVHELDADTRAIGLLEDGQDLAERRPSQPQNAVDIDRPVVIDLREAVAFRIELGMMLAALDVEGIQARDQVAAHAIGPG